jgi:hypothetical protein
MLFQMPKPVTIMGRSSSITNAFVNGIIPCIEPSDDEIKEALRILEMSEENVQCIYCGDKATEWDHLRPLIYKKRPTGYISEIHNLVPACGKCNQSKGNKEWRTWIISDAKLSPKMKGVTDIDNRVQLLEKYEQWGLPKKIDFQDIVGTELWSMHWANYNQLMHQMEGYQVVSDKIKDIIKKEYK